MGIEELEQTAWKNYDVVASIRTQTPGLLVTKSGQVKIVQKWTDTKDPEKVDVRCDLFEEQKNGRATALKIADYLLSNAIKFFILVPASAPLVLLAFFYYAKAKYHQHWMNRIGIEFGEQAIIRAQNFWQNGPKADEFIPRDSELAAQEVANLDLREDPLADRGLKLLKVKPSEQMIPSYRHAFNWKKENSPERLALAIGQLATGKYVDEIWTGTRMERSEAGLYLTSLFDEANAHYCRAMQHYTPPQPSLLDRFLARFKTESPVTVALD